MNGPWCVRTRRDGTFRSARRGSIVTLDFDSWAEMDPAAAGQFLEPPKLEQHLRVQRAFMSATGLDSSARLAASMTDAHNVFLGGSNVTTASPSRPRPVDAARPR